MSGRPFGRSWGQTGEVFRPVWPGYDPDHDLNMYYSNKQYNRTHQHTIEAANAQDVRGTQRQYSSRPLPNNNTGNKVIPFYQVPSFNEQMDHQKTSEMFRMLRQKELAKARTASNETIDRMLHNIQTIDANTGAILTEEQSGNVIQGQIRDVMYKLHHEDGMLINTRLRQLMEAQKQLFAQTTTTNQPNMENVQKATIIGAVEQWMKEHGD